jgi:uncharacterized damage-inducible protein DinB
MTNREFCIERRAQEMPAFLRVLKALPEGRLDYRPDPKSRTARELAWQLACSETCLAELLKTGKAAWPTGEAPARIDEIVSAYERSSAAVNQGLKGLDEAGWGKKSSLVFGEASWEDATGAMAWGFLFDAIHHRGQLTTYLRPMGAKVPSIYGPSADDSGQ